MNAFTKRRFYDMIIARNEITIRLGEKRGDWRMLFVEYQNALLVKSKKWLEDQNISFTDRHIVEGESHVRRIEGVGGQRWSAYETVFNTSGMKYRECS